MPTEQELTDAAADLTSINGQVFSVWQAEHGGDQALTAKRIAKQLYADAQAQNRILRSIVKLTIDELNDLRQWIAAYKVEVAAAI